MRIRLFVSILFICAFAYNSMAQTNDDHTEKYFSGMNFPNFEEPNTGLARAVQFRDTLVITVDIPYPGPPGGIKEKIVIYRNESMKLNALFTRDTLSGELRRGIKVIKTLSLKDEYLLNLFIHRILELNLNQDLYKWNEEEEPEEIAIFSGSPTSIEIRNTSNELFLLFKNIGQTANTWYHKIRNEIFDTY